MVGVLGAPVADPLVGIGITRITLRICCRHWPHRTPRLADPSGHAADPLRPRNGKPAGVDAVHVWAYPASGPARFIGAATYGSSRPDVAAVFGARFGNSAWTVAADLDPGPWTIVAYLHSSISGGFILSSSVAINVEDSLLLQIDVPETDAVAPPNGRVAGWALDLSSTSGPGIDTVQVWAIDADTDEPSLVGHSELGVSRPDVGAAFGDQFSSSGFSVPYTLPPGTYDIYVYGHRLQTNNFDIVRAVRVTIQ